MKIFYELFDELFCKIEHERGWNGFSKIVQNRLQDAWSPRQEDLDELPVSTGLVSAPTLRKDSSALARRRRIPGYTCASVLVKKKRQ